MFFPTHAKKIGWADSSPPPPPLLVHQVHAAVAVVRYKLKRAGAEEEWAVATSLEPRWGNDAAFVRGRWPPRMVEAWEDFSELK